MNIKIEGWKVTIHNENGDRLELKGEFEAEFFKEYENKQLIIANVVWRSEQLLCDCEAYTYYEFEKQMNERKALAHNWWRIRLVAEIKK